MANRFDGVNVDTSFIAYDQYKYVQRLVNKYGAPSTNMPLSTLEAMAKDIQRESNRRFDTAQSRPNMKDTNAYKLFARQGKIALSKGFRYDKVGNRYFDPVNAQELLSGNPSGQAIKNRKAYLLREIKRGMTYLDSQTSSVTGYRVWKANSIAGVGQALVQLVNRTHKAGTAAHKREMRRIAKLQRMLEKSERDNKKFWKIYNAYKRKYGKEKVIQIGSDVIIATIDSFFDDSTAYLVSEYVAMIEEVVQGDSTIEEAVEKLHGFKQARAEKRAASKAAKLAQQGGDNNDADAAGGGANS